MAPLRRSLQAWQLGETSDGRHLAASADRFATATGDPAYRDVIDLFIREEQRHGALLGRVLDDAGIARRQADWGDTLFRRLRYSVTDIEVWTTPVVMVEVLAMVYYNAIRRATGSPVLRAVCAQILADEVPHVQLQCERLAVLLHSRSRARFRCTMLAHRILFLAVMVLVWVGHHRALRAGGYTWTHYRRAACAKMNRAWIRNATSGPDQSRRVASATPKSPNRISSASSSQISSRKSGHLSRGLKNKKTFSVPSRHRASR
ncbi:ferritin-like domain-containing protein [Nocardia asteroides]